MIRVNVLPVLGWEEGGIVFVDVCDATDQFGLAVAKKEWEFFRVYKVMAHSLGTPVEIPYDETMSIPRYKIRYLAATNSCVVLGVEGARVYLWTFDVAPNPPVLTDHIVLSTGVEEQDIANFGWEMVTIKKGNHDLITSIGLSYGNTPT